MHNHRFSMKTTLLFPLLASFVLTLSTCSDRDAAKGLNDGAKEDTVELATCPWTEALASGSQDPSLIALQTAQESRHEPLDTDVAQTLLDLWATRQPIEDSPTDWYWANPFPVEAVDEFIGYELHPYRPEPVGGALGSRWDQYKDRAAIANGRPAYVLDDCTIVLNVVAVHSERYAYRMMAVALRPDGTERWRIRSGLFQKVADGEGAVWFNAYGNPYRYDPWNTRNIYNEPITGTLMKVSSDGALRWFLRYNPSSPNWNRSASALRVLEEGTALSISQRHTGARSSDNPLYSTQISLSGEVIGKNRGVRMVAQPIEQPNSHPSEEWSPAAVLEFDSVSVSSLVSEASRDLNIAPVTVIDGFDAYTDGARIFLGQDLVRSASSALLRQILVHEQAHIESGDVAASSLLADFADAGLISGADQVELNQLMEYNADGVSAVVAALEGSDPSSLATFVLDSEEDADHSSGMSRALFIDAVYTGMMEGVLALGEKLGHGEVDLSGYVENPISDLVEDGGAAAFDDGFASVFGELAAQDIDMIIEGVLAEELGWDETADYWEEYQFDEDNSEDWGDYGFEEADYEYDGSYDDGSYYDDSGYDDGYDDWL